MGNAMRTYGSGLRLRANVAETDVLTFAREYLLDPDVERMVPVPDRYSHETVAASTTLEQLLGAFRQVLVRDQAGAVTAMLGRDGNYRDPSPLLEALAPSLVQGSWYACGTDYDGDFVWHVSDTGLERVIVEDMTMDVGRASENLEWGFLADLTELPYAETDDSDTAQTKLARALTKVPGLIDGKCADRGDELTFEQRLAAEGNYALVL